MRAIRTYEVELSHALLDILEETPGVTVCGPTDRQHLEEGGGIVRVGPVHFNTIHEIENFGETLNMIAGKYPTQARSVQSAWRISPR